MHRYESLRKKFANCEPVCGTTCTLLMDPIVISKMDHTNLDFMLFDAEHGRYDAQNVFPLLHMCRMMGLPSIVRIQDAYYCLAAKPLDMGANVYWTGTDMQFLQAGVKDTFDQLAQLK